MKAVTSEHLTERETQFAYFDAILASPSWAKRKILDFGGNNGIFLRNARGIDHADYWCMDVHAPALARGRAAYPRAHFVHYDRYSTEFNPDGVLELPIPDCGTAFDFILAFSVFTHVHRAELQEYVTSLRSMLAPRGVLAFTFCDPRHDRSLSDPSLPPGPDTLKNLAWFAKHTATEIAELVERGRRSRWCIAVDGELYIDPDDLSPKRCRQQGWGTYCSYFTTELVQEMFPDAAIHPPVKPEWQHCAVLTNGLRNS